MSHFGAPSASKAVDVAIVGGGPAGAALGIELAAAGIETAIFERSAQPTWRACGVFSSPLTRGRLMRLGLSEAELDALSRPINALNLRTIRKAKVRLEYAPRTAYGFDRPRLDATLLQHAAAAGAAVRMGHVVKSVSLSDGGAQSARLAVAHTGRNSEPGTTWSARLVVGADGPQSLVARAARVHKPVGLRRAGITFHRADPAAELEGQPMEGDFLLGDGWYVGVAPVPGGRVNVGIVVPDTFLSDPLDEVVRHALKGFGLPANGWQSASRLDDVTVALPLAHRVERSAGPGYMLVGDAAGFLDPLTGEGLHRALVSSEYAAESIVRRARGEQSAFEDYDQRLRARFRNKDVVSWLLQAFLARPSLLDYAVDRLGRRPDLRRTMTLVLTDQVRASRALDPRFLARLLAP